MPEARRTLVKSPPELWAEISDPECLAKHLEAFGEIRITRVDPESTVAWEGDRARGTVELSASGWGTKVLLTAEVTEQDEPVQEEPEPAPPAPVEEPPAAVAEPEPVEEPVAVEEPRAEEPPPPPAPVPAPAAEMLPARKRGFFARLFGKKTAAVVAPLVAEEPRAEEPPRVEEPQPVEGPVAVIEEPIAVVEEPVAVIEEPVAAVEEPVEVLEEPPAPEPEVISEPDPPGEIKVSRLGDEEAAAVLDSVLDTLGSAHHRPFSR